MANLDQADRWELKGEGNANWVFTYSGSLSHLVGKVLRISKPKPPQIPEQLALEEAVWGQVLACDPVLLERSPAAARQQAYVQQLLLPLLGEQYVPQQQLVDTPGGFIQQLLLHTGCISSPMAAAAAEAECSAWLMPDVTLVAGGTQRRLPCSAQQQHCLLGSPQPAVVGPAVCIELKPKCGFVANGCDTVDPHNRVIKRSRSRYQLHQMLKLSQGKVATVSSYDPCDLFSGEPARLRSALAALLDAPQNNLRLFVDGRGAQLAEQQRQLAQSQPGGQGEFAEQQAAVSDQVQQGNNSMTQPPRERRRSPDQQHLQSGLAITVDEQLAQLLPVPAGHRGGALVELLAAVLERERVLPRLLAAQRQCAYDVEGVYRLYCQLAGISATHVQRGGSSGGSGSGMAAEHAQHTAAVRRLLSLPPAEAHAVLRSYAVAATAKDCAIMVTLQRLAAGPGPAEQAGCGANRAACGQQRQGQRECASVCGAHVNGTPAVHQLYCDAAHGWFAYRLAFVDLDLKPLTKIPQHFELDAAIVAAARRHLAGDAGGTGVHG